MSEAQALDAPRTLPPGPIATSEPAAPLPEGLRPPIRVVELELAGTIPDLLATTSPDGVPYRQALVLVRLHGEPLGLLPIDLPARLPADDLARAVWNRFHSQIARHLAADGEPPAALRPPGCRHGRRRPVSPSGLRLRDVPLASVVVTTCDRPFQLLRTLEDLLVQTYPSFELIVVDNRPGAGFTREAVTGRYGADPRVRYLAEPRMGLSAARNAGLAHARGALVAFTDDDVTVDRHWLSSLAQVLLDDRDTACVTGLILPLELDTPAQLLFEQFGGFGKGFQRRSFDLAPNHPPDALFPYAAGRFGSGATPPSGPTCCERSEGSPWSWARALPPAAARTSTPTSTSSRRPPARLPAACPGMASASARPAGAVAADPPVRDWAQRRAQQTAGGRP